MHALFARFRPILLGWALFLLGAGGVPRAMASHYAAVDLHADFIGSDSTDLRYRVTLQVYKLCWGTNQPSQPDLASSEPLLILSANAGATIYRSFPITNLHTVSFNNPVVLPPLGHGPFDTLEQLCGNAVHQSLCWQPNSISSFPGYVRATYIDTLTLPARATDWKFVWTNSARDATILNISPVQGNIWCEAGLNNLQPGRWNNSTPRYSISPVQYLCANKPDQFINGPVEPPADMFLDSMVTLNIYPQNAGGANYSYNPGYSLLNPVMAAMPAGYFVNPITGTAYFTPTVVGKFALAFRTYEYARFGPPNQPRPLMGYVSRDVQILAMTCAAGGNPPIIWLPPVQLAGGVLLADSIVSVPVNQTVTMDIGAKAALAGDSILFYAFNNFVAPGSQFTVTYPSPDSALGHFTWTPALSDTGSHTVVLLAIDSTCVDGLLIPQYAYRNLILKVTAPSGTGVGSVSNPGGMSIWPNPAGKTLYLKGEGIERTELYTVSGQLVSVRQHPSGSLDISQLAPGLYTIRIITKEGYSIYRFQKE